jgi:hypothetical protein
MYKITARVRGGIGNQLFIYAAARRLAFRNNCDLILDIDTGFYRDFVFKRKSQLHHFNINCSNFTKKQPLTFLSRLIRFLHRLINSKLPLSKRSYISQSGMDYDSRFKHLKVSRNLYLEGYWQSEKYFKDVEYLIRNDLTLTPPNDKKNMELIESIRKTTSISLHVRFFYDNLQDTMSNYYSKAIEKINLLYPKSHFFIFCDKPDKVASFINLPSERFTLVDHNIGDDLAYCDLWLMSNCKHHVIANSTFSWWGAWLSENKHKTVIAPDPERFNDSNFWKAKNLIPDEWIIL